MKKYEDRIWWALFIVGCLGVAVVALASYAIDNYNEQQYQEPITPTLRVPIYDLMGVATYEHPVFGTQANLDGQWSVSEAVAAARRFDALYDTHYAEHKYEPGTMELQLLIMEVAPYFQYEGITNNVYLPETAAFEPQLDGRAHNHIGGYVICRANPKQRPLRLNFRIVNPLSAKYGVSWYYSTVVHELGHVQGICNSQGTMLGREEAETETELAMLEVMAAMVNHGNVDFVPALLSELSNMAWGTAAALVWEQDGSLDRYLELRLEGEDALVEARIRKALRYWAGDMATLSYIFDAYSKGPWDRVLTAMNGEEIVVEKFPIAKYGVCSGYGQCDPDADFYWEMDDLKYFLENIDAIVLAAASK